MSEVFIFTTLVLACIILLLLIVVLAKIGDAVNGINRKLELLMQHAGMNVYEVAAREAQLLMRDGKKIDAIRRYRELTGAGLAEAKAAVEKL